MTTFSYSDLSILLPAIHANWHNLRVLIVGDVMLDKYAFGQVDRISPEAPVPVVRAIHTREQAGGAANVAMNIAQLGAKTILAGFVGQDSDHLILSRLLTQNNIDCLFIEEPHIPTTSKFRIIGGHQQIVRLDFENTEPHSDESYERLLAIVSQVLPSVDVVILSDYAKGTLNHKICQHIIQQAKNNYIPVFVDPKVRDFSCYKGATTICPNLSELALATGYSNSDIKNLFLAGQLFVKQYNLEYLIVTLSEKGIAVLWSDKRELLPATAKQVFDVSGAGDTVISILALCIASKLPITLAARLANLAASIVVSKVGTVPISRDELLMELESAHTPQIHEKIFSLSQLIPKVERWHSENEAIVFTNGCFDLLHVGHVTLLEKSKGLGTKLIVGINSDNSVTGLKGEKRPIIGEQERAGLLAALSAVDAVVIFDEPTPIELVNALKPHVLVKGGDYIEANVVGASEVRSWGGQVVLVPTVEGFSTTKIVEKLNTH